MAGEPSRSRPARSCRSRRRCSSSWRHRTGRSLAPLALILLAYVALALGYALGTPRWNNPDEPAHYNYIAHLARTNQFPLLEPGDWDSERLGERLASGRFTTQEPIERFRYESHQPPLYYLLIAPVYRGTERLGANAHVVALRLPSIGLGALLLVVVYTTARVLAPRRAELAPLAAGLVAFVPMHTAMTATINNDTLAELLAAATLLATLLGLRDGFGLRGALAVGVLGAGLLLTKLTVYLYAPLALLALTLRAGVDDLELARRAALAGRAVPFHWRRAATQAALALGVMAALAGWWFLRNLAVYGWPDLFGLIRHDQVVVGQPRWPGFGDEPLRFFLYSVFRSFWAQFGWMAVVLDPRLYALFLLFILLAAGGLVRFWRRELPTWPPAAAIGLRFLVAGLAFVVAELVIYNLSFIQAQGRYLYPAMLPLAILLALGWSTVAAIDPRASRWRWLGFALGFYLVWAMSVEALTWLAFGAPAPIFLHLVPILPAWLATRIPVRRPPESLAGIAATALLTSLALVNSAALLRFVVPYFQGW